MDKEYIAKESIKELLIANMPPYPQKRSNLVSLYGRGVISAIDDLMAENKLIRVKKGYYSLSDDILDERGADPDEYKDLEEVELKELMPTETLKIIVSAWVSQYRVTTLLEHNLGSLLTEVNYYTTTSTGENEGNLEESLESLLIYLRGYRYTIYGEQLLKGLTER